MNMKRAITCVVSNQKNLLKSIPSLSNVLVNPAINGYSSGTSNSKILCQRCLDSSKLRITRRTSTTYSVLNKQPKSWLFVSNKVGGKYRALVNLDLDEETRLQNREALEKLRTSLKARRSSIDLEKLCKDHADMLAAFERKEKVESSVETTQDMFKEAKSPEEIEGLRQTLRRLRKDVKRLAKELYAIEEPVMLQCLNLPSDLHPTTPIDEEIVVREKEGSRQPQKMNHIEAGQKYGLIKFSSVGPKAFYLLGELAVAEWAVADLAADFLSRKGFRQTAGPAFCRSPVMEACGKDFLNPEKVLSLQHSLKAAVEPLDHLPGVSAQTLAAYVARLCFADQNLPFKIYSCGKTYQKSDLPGLYGALQSTQASYLSCHQESESDATFEAAADMGWALVQALGFSCRQVSVPARDLGREERRRWLTQVLAPSLGRWVTIGHVSDMGDYVSRRLMIRHNDDINQFRNAAPVHMVSGTLLNVTSLLAAWVEHTDLETAGLGL